MLPTYEALKYSGTFPMERGLTQGVLDDRRQLTLAADSVGAWIHSLTAGVPANKRVVRASVLFSTAVYNTPYSTAYSTVHSVATCYGYVYCSCVRRFMRVRSGRRYTQAHRILLPLSLYWHCASCRCHCMGTVPPAAVTAWADACCGHGSNRGCSGAAQDGARGRRQCEQATTKLLARECRHATLRYEHGTLLYFLFLEHCENTV